MESSRHELVLGGLGQQVARDLLHDEPVERHVVVQRLDDPVAVAPDRSRPVDRVAVRVGVARDVEPVPAPALAVMRRLEQALHQPAVRAGLRVARERANLLGRREQARQIQASPADERSTVRFRRGLQASLVEPRQHESIDGVGRSTRVPHGRRLGPLYGAERPERLGADGIGAALAPRGAVADPLADRLHLMRLQRARRRHLQGAGPLDGRQQDAVLRAARHDRRAPRTALQRRFPGRERETAGLDLLAVARLAARREQRTDPLLEKAERVALGCQRRRGEENAKDGGPSKHR